MKKKKKKTGKKKVVKAVNVKKTKKVKPVKAKKLTTSKICCTKCGECKGMSKDRRAKLLSQFGSEEALHEQYVCRTCRKELNMRKDGKVKPPKRTRKAKPDSLKRDANGEITLPEWMLHIKPRENRPCSDEDLGKLNICFATSYWSAHNHCNGCHRLEKGVCGALTKVILSDKDLAKASRTDGIGKAKKIKKTKKGKK